MPTQEKAIRYAFFRSIDAAGVEWDAAAPRDNVFLRREYLSVLEANPPVGMRFGYLVFYAGEQAIGVALCQIKYFKGDDNITDLNTPEKDPCFFTAMGSWLKRWVAGMVAADVLICGNMLLTGEHGYYFNPQYLRPHEAGLLLEKALNDVVDALGREGIKIPAILIKDVDPGKQGLRTSFVEKGFTEFDIQPNMVLDLKHFSSFDSYLATMTTKYRTRAKRAFKKLDGVEKRELSVADVQRELPQIYALYKDVAKNAGFNMVDLNEHYLLALKKDFSSHFRIFGYYKEEKLLAFYTTIQDEHKMEAHFLGYDKEQNHDLQLYLNCLYDIIRIGFEGGCHEITFARTALEIKSSVGAVPHELFCHLRHQNSFANHFTGTILDYLKPVEKWGQRHPFKEEEGN